MKRFAIWCPIHLRIELIGTSIKPRKCIGKREGIPNKIANITDDIVKVIRFDNDVIKQTAQLIRTLGDGFTDTCAF